MRCFPNVLTLVTRDQRLIASPGEMHECICILYSGLEAEPQTRAAFAAQPDGLMPRHVRMLDTLLHSHSLWMLHDADF